ncbi:PREDICTED: mediator of RNA polymerase II transcription subunit 9-like [Rhagoletis zephyria]|uniref:mediator of RNA polymerase II transcription subunit 9-like n=1 Tax=Rhagoletis zephyria TaxID=28612 RepID=UPI00081168CE|nr:PREDICTED: mediator of RNA polymerase II transcription subunit 9-like [Rhagoletis zephyria]XP_017485504.1 PREDICTED: mediator of RNA polymerase II transcription subunit 9-like [Rhagoletis zephyria]XP_017485505.1 PREDICTED: mediator of RNA polymerase II transcription subunit 9-like [Rhagoletis zephyria]XP_036330289.1 mediator of RNA polymerase II transcription subunit 9 [Rhagoletis pomonella]
MMELSPGGQPVDKKPILTPDGLVQTNTTNSAAPETVSNTPSPSSGANTNLTAILPVVYEIIRCVEKDPLDNAAKQRESQECSQKILELQKRFEIARVEVKQLPGIDYNKEEQLQRLELLRNQLKLKQQLIRKYKDTTL